MKWFIIISVVVLFISYLVWPRRQVKVRGRISELSEYLRGLMTSNSPHAFLIVDLLGSPHFIQFSGDNSGIQLNMPLITSEQISMKSILETACRNEGLMPLTNKGTDGSEFIYCNINGEIEIVISALENIVKIVFGVKKDNKVRYTLAGYCLRVTPKL